MSQELHEQHSSERQVSCRKGWRRFLGLHGERAVSLDLEHGNKVNTAIKCGEGNPLQYSCLENPMDGGAW